MRLVKLLDYLDYSHISTVEPALAKECATIYLFNMCAVIVIVLYYSVLYVVEFKMNELN